jgi:hypothetical protein
MSIAVTVTNDLLQKAMAKMVERMPGIGDVLARHTAFTIIANVVERVPVDTGRYRAGWLVSLDVLGGDDAGSESETVEVFGEGDALGITVTNPVEYGPYIEYGTASRPPGNHLALAIDSTRRRLQFGRGENSLSAEVAAAWKEVT